MSALDYSKWDALALDDDAEEKASDTHHFELGDDSLAPVEESFWSDGSIPSSLKRLELREKEVWQLCIKKLRVWSARSDSSKDAPVPCRPYFVMLTMLYPRGRMLGKFMTSPPEKEPSAAELLDFLASHMRDPAGDSQHRPGKLVCPVKAHAEMLSHSLSEAGIETTILSEVAGLDDYVAAFSKSLVEKDLAAVSPNANIPGLLASTGVQPAFLESFFEVARVFYRRQPWKELFEKQLLGIRVDKPRHEDGFTVPPGIRWGSVIGHNTEDARGLAFFTCQADAESRFLPSAMPLRLSPERRCCASCGKRQEEGKELLRCTRCQHIYYCNRKCQRAHWPLHKKDCVARKAGKPFWAKREVSLLFDSCVMMPFDDMDAIEAHDLPIALSDPRGYPLPNAHVLGESRRPSAEELVWLQRFMEAFISIVSRPLSILDPSAVLHQRELSLRGEIDLIGSGERVELTNCCIIPAPDDDEDSEEEDDDEEAEEEVEGAAAAPAASEGEEAVHVPGMEAEVAPAPAAGDADVAE